jgi:hypothetical protein
MAVLTVRLPANQVAEVDAAARRLGLDRSRFLRAAILAGVVHAQTPDQARRKVPCPDCGEPMAQWAGQVTVASGVLGPPKTWRCHSCERTHAG